MMPGMNKSLFILVTVQDMDNVYHGIWLEYHPLIRSYRVVMRRGKAYVCIVGRYYVSKSIWIDWWKVPRHWDLICNTYIPRNKLPMPFFKYWPLTIWEMGHICGWHWHEVKSVRPVWIQTSMCMVPPSLYYPNGNRSMVSPHMTIRLVYPSLRHRNVVIHRLVSIQRYITITWSTIYYPNCKPTWPEWPTPLC